MLSVAVLILAIFAALAFSNWRLGFFLTVAMAFLQDPLRKLTEGEPSIYIVFAAVVFGASTLRVLSAGVSPLPLTIPVWSRHVGLLLIVFIAILCIQAVNSFLRFGSPIVPALGFVNYIAPFVALTVSYRFAVGAGFAGLRQFFLFYLVLAGIGFVTIFLEWSGVEWSILGEVGPGIYITTFGGLDAYSGTFRASEVAAWHCATASCLVFILLTADRLTASRLLLAILIVLAIVSIGVLTGRRKFVVVIALFLVFYFALQATFLRRTRRDAIAAALLGAVVYGVSYLMFDLNPEPGQLVQSEYDLYVSRTKTVFGELGGRAYQLGLLPIGWAYHRFGLMGAGLGVGTQGVGYVADLGGAMGGAAEGGLGKLMIELGAAGLLAALLMVVGIGRMFREVLLTAAARSRRACRYACGFVAILIANIASFSVATQVFGDFFILILLGVIAGAAIAMPAIARRTVLRHRSVAQSLAVSRRPMRGGPRSRPA